MHGKYTSKDVERFWGKVQKTDNPNDCWLWNSTHNKAGYGVIRIGGLLGHTLLAHRVAHEIVFGEIPKGLKILHKCDNPPCCNPDHLFRGTDQDNTHDKMSKGRQMRREKHWNCKLTEEQISEIRRRYSFRGRNGESARDLAREFGVKPSNISQIVNYKSWK